MKLKKVFALMLCVLMFVPSLCTAEETLWQDKNIAIDETQITWVGKEKFDDLALVTRGETAALAAKALGMVYSGDAKKYKDVSAAYGNRISAVTSLGIMNGSSDGYFYPDEHITREELAAVAVRAYDAVSQSPVAAPVKEDVYEDQNQISEWALEYIFKAVQLKAISAKNKLIRPQEYATRAECLEAIAKAAGLNMFEYTKTVVKNPESENTAPGTPAQTPGNTEEVSKPETNSEMIMPRATEPLGSILDGRDMGTVTEVAADKDVSSAYDVYQKSIVTNQMGNTGMYMKARFDANTPIKLYAARTTTKPEIESSVPFAPSSYVRVSDPDGKLVGFYDFSEVEGKQAVEIAPSVKKEGIWTFTITGGRTGDTVEFGFSGSSSWGIGGMHAYTPTETTPKDLYVYCQPQAKEFLVVTSAGSSLTVTDETGKKVPQEDLNSAWYKKKYLATPAIGDSVYKLTPGGAKNEYFAIDFATSLMCPTAEMAKDLKGGWVESHGVLMQGPLQAKLRDLAIDIINNCDLDVDIGEIPPLPAKEDIKNIMAEAQMFGAYGPINGLSNTLDCQILDTEHPYVGYIDTGYKDGKTTYADYSAGEFMGVNLTILNGLSTALMIPSQLNYFYGNEQLMRRCELYLLSGLYTLSEEMFARENRLDAGGTGTTHAGFWFSFTSKGFENLKPFLPAEDLELIEEAMIAYADAQSNYRGYLTNQHQHCIEGIMSLYLSTGLERYHNAFKTQIKTVINSAPGWKHFGFNHEGGYYVENFGYDGTNYTNLNQFFFGHLYRVYSALDNADEEICKGMEQVIHENMVFESYSWLTNPLNLELDYMQANAATCRTTSMTGGINGYPGKEIIMYMDPLAKRRQELQSHDDAGAAYPATTFPHMLSNEDWAYKLLEECYPNYDKAMPNRTSGGWTADLFGAFEDAYYGEGKDLEPAQIPCEGEDFVKEYTGFIAYKSNGIYGYTQYDFEPEWSYVAQAWLGGGPDVIWSEKTGGSLASVKPDDYMNPKNLDSADKIKHTCVYFTDSTGAFRVSGKEKSTLKWIEQDKIWEISGTIPETNQTVTWRYELTDNGVTIKVSLSNPKGVTAWVNLPLYSREDGKALNIEKYSEGSLDIGRGSEVMTYKWDSEKSQLADPSGQTRNLRVQIPKSGEVTIELSCR